MRSGFCTYCLSPLCVMTSSITRTALICKRQNASYCTIYHSSYLVNSTCFYFNICLIFFFIKEQHDCMKLPNFKTYTFFIKYMLHNLTKILEFKFKTINYYFSNLLLIMNTIFFSSIYK